MKQKRFYTQRWFTLLAIVFGFGLFIPACELTDEQKEALATIFQIGDSDYYGGWYNSASDTTEVEDDVTLGSAAASSSSLPSSVDLLDKFPPIGNQGPYGTCVAWSVGYNIKTFLEAVDHKRTSSSLSNTSYQFSPKYLFWKIPNSKKGEDCGGTGFQAAFDILVEYGLPTMADVPYDNLGDCSQSPSSADDSKAEGYKIERYRNIDIDVQTLKGYLADGRAISFGARLGDSFMDSNSDAILSFDTYNYTGQHAYHAMALSGYDDSKNAFRVVNSWGTSWGDNGYIWVDYDFFVREFCFAAYVATNSMSDPDDDGDGNVEPDDQSTGKDLATWDLTDYQDSDYPNDPLARVVEYNAYNTGTTTIPASDDWAVVYLAYNAYDADEMYILLYDYYSDDYGSYGQYDLLELDWAEAAFWNYLDVPAGKSIAEALFESTAFQVTYTMPNITGDFYFVILADAYDVISEENEENNYYFMTDVNGDPVRVENGVIKSSLPVSKRAKKPGLFADSPSPDLRQKDLNTYSPDEIYKVYHYQMKTGQLQKRTMNNTTKRAGHKPNKKVVK